MYIYNEQKNIYNKIMHKYVAIDQIYTHMIYKACIQIQHYSTDYQGISVCILNFYMKTTYVVITYC